MTSTHPNSPSGPLKVVLIGAGNRSLCYGHYAELHPDQMQVVGIAEPDSHRLQAAAKRFQVPPEACFSSVDQLVTVPDLADAAINGTMDREHVVTTLPLLKAGFDVLLEKPFACNDDELNQLVAAVESSQRLLMICHVLRYAPFYQAIRERVAAGEIGDLVHLRTTEHVSYHHMVSAFVRGKWNQRRVNPILLAKCCHDLDLICWMKSGVAPRRVSSFGGRNRFTRQQAPEGAGTRCLVDCPIERDCTYSAKRLYLEQKLWGGYAWAGLKGGELTESVKWESLQTDNPFGRCVWDCDNDVADHQGVMIEFADGCTAQHALVGGAVKAERQIYLSGTLGEIEGSLEEGVYTVRKPSPGSSTNHCVEEEHRVNVSGSMHGGGDLRLVKDFLRVVRGAPPSIATSHLGDSLASHRIAFAADRAMLHAEVVELMD